MTVESDFSLWYQRRIQTRNYTNKAGVKAYTTDIIVEEQEFADGKNLNGNYRISKNIELWNELIPVYKSFTDIKSIWIRGHNGNSHNEEVDRAAVEESKKWQ